MGEVVKLPKRRQHKPGNKGVGREGARDSKVQDLIKEQKKKLDHLEKNLEKLLQYSVFEGVSTEQIHTIYLTVMDRIQRKDG